MPIHMGTFFDITGFVTQYGYNRHARVTDRILELDRSQESGNKEELDRWEQKLADAAGARVDNKAVYEITHNGHMIYVWFVDFTVIVGFTIKLDGS